MSYVRLAAVSSSVLGLIACGKVEVEPDGGGQSVDAPIADAEDTVDATAVDAPVDAAIDAAPPPVLWPDSLTRFCTNGSSGVACPGGVAGQDGNYVITAPAYTVAPNNVIDTVTGLQWERNPPYTPRSYTAANVYCDNLTTDGFTDWRLPTIVELASLVDAGRINPWPVTQFPNIPGNSFFYSSTPTLAGGAHHAINTNYPVVVPWSDTDTTAGLVRCVRGALPAQTLTVAGGSVTDSRTGLVWQSGTGAAATWANALAFCENLTLDGVSDWRAPNVKELYSIVDATRSNPAISTVFSSRPTGGQWTSTGVPNTPTSAYAIDFTNGVALNIDTPVTQALPIRCVH